MKIITLLTLIFFTSCSWSQKQDLRTVDYVDVPRYVGTWYAISAFPQFFTRNCLGQTAEYKVINPQTISVLNTCFKKKGKKSSIKGEAVVSNPATNAELIVTFDNFLTRLFRVKGDYNIIALDADYKYVTVASRDRKSLWIMSRTATMPDEIYQQYVKAAADQKFPVEKLVKSEF